MTEIQRQFPVHPNELYKEYLNNYWQLLFSTATEVGSTLINLGLIAGDTTGDGLPFCGTVWVGMSIFLWGSILNSANRKHAIEGRFKDIYQGGAMTDQDIAYDQTYDNAFSRFCRNVMTSNKLPRLVRFRALRDSWQE